METLEQKLTPFLSIHALASRLHTCEIQPGTSRVRLGFSRREEKAEKQSRVLEDSYLPTFFYFRALFSLLFVLCEREEENEEEEVFRFRSFAIWIGDLGLLVVCWSPSQSPTSGPQFLSSIHLFLVLRRLQELFLPIFEMISELLKLQNVLLSVEETVGKKLSAERCQLCCLSTFAEAQKHAAIVVWHSGLVSNESRSPVYETARKLRGSERFGVPEQ
ncbi:hypothetical protein ACLOJK_020360 [Asimina triloba]